MVMNVISIIGGKMSPSSHFRKTRSIWFLSLLVVPIVGLFSFTAATAESTASISQGFKTTETDLATGAIVSLTGGSQNTIQLANTSRVNDIIGLIGDRPLIELSNNDKEVQVVISGTTVALVSNING